MQTMNPDWRLLLRAFYIAFDQRKLAICLLWLTLGLLGAELALYTIGGQHLWQYGEVYACLAAGWRQQPWLYLAAVAVVVFWFYLWGCYLLGAVYRLSAVELATGERISARTALAYSGTRYGALFWSKVTLVIVVALLAGSMLLAGRVASLIVLHFPGIWAGLLLLALWLPVLIASLFSLLLAMVWLCSSSFMPAAIAMDDTDHYDAVSRSIMYFYHSLLRFSGRQLGALAYGLVVFALFAGFAIAMWQLAYTLANWGAAPMCVPDLWKPLAWTAHLNTSAPATPLLFALLPLVYWGVIASFAVALYITLQTIVYALQRHAVDAIPITSIVHSEKEKV